MSWKDRLENIVFTITTGDGKVYTPLWKNGETSKEFNATIFDFISLPGGLVDRKQVKARSFPLTFWFQGDDNIEQSEAFDQSANDPRAWTVRHPFYGDITGQPLTLSRNDLSYNITEINVDFWETITESLPKKTASIPDAVKSVASQLVVVSPQEYAAKVDLAPADVVMVKDTTQKISANISALLNSQTYSDYQLSKNNAFAKIDNMIAEPAAAIKAINDLVQLPSEFALSVSTRLTLMRAVYNSAKDILGIRESSNNKSFFEVIGAAAISGAAITAVLPLSGDYITRSSVADTSKALSDMYADYLNALDNAYVPVSEIENAYSASPETRFQLQNMVTETISSLGQLAFEAKQERTATLDRDTNLIVLTHKYLGLDADDKNIDQFRTINRIKNKSLFQLKKGRQIKYLV